MRSRYSAYALHLVEYIINTTHANLHEPLPYWRESISFFCSHTFFKNLEILEEECGFPFSTVTFKATLLQEGQIVILTEKSTFISIENNWLYYKMDIL
jgi:SEC-C motif-containing protein